MYVDAENLPVQFGGLDTTPWPEAEPGPWDVYVKDAHVHGNNIRHLFRDDADIDEDRVKPRMFSDTPEPKQSPTTIGAATDKSDDGTDVAFMATPPSPTAVPEAADGGDSLLSRIGLLEIECSRYKALLLSSPREFNGQHPPGSVLGRLEVLEQAMVEIKTAQKVAMDRGGDPTQASQTPRQQQADANGFGDIDAADDVADTKQAHCYCALQ